MMPGSDEQQDNSFPIGYKHIEEWVQTVENRLQQLDAELGQPLGGLRLRFDPPGSGTPPPPPRRSREAIQQEKADLKAEAYGRIEKETVSADPRTRKDINDKALSRIYREDIEKLKAAERGLPSPDQGWGLEEKQLMLLNKLKDYRDSQRALENRQPPSMPRRTDIEPTR